MLSNPYFSGEVQSRYIISQTVMVRSAQPDLIRRANQGVFVILPRDNVQGVYESKQYTRR